MPSTVVGTAIQSTPRRKIEAAKPARSVSTPPPIASTTASRPAPDSTHSWQSDSTISSDFESSPAGDNYLKHWYEPDGQLDIPVLTLHTSMDAVVPLFHEPAYAETVAAAGRSEMLVQRTVDRYGHCAFTGPEQIGAFLDLVAWVETGVAPTP